MSRKKTTDPDEPRAPISLRRIEVRTEMVPLNETEKVARLEVAAGIEREISSQELRLIEAAEIVKKIKSAIDNKTSELRVAVREAHDGHKGSDYDVIVERHPDHPAEMMVWRAPDGAIVADLIAEEVRIGETLITTRERQGCSLVEVRAMSGEELDAAEAEDHKARHPELPIDGLDAPVVVESVGGVAADLPPCDPETGIAEPAGERLIDGMTDEEWESEPFLTDNPPTPITEGKKAKGKRGRKVA